MIEGNYRHNWCTEIDYSLEELEILSYNREGAKNSSGKKVGLVPSR